MSAIEASSAGVKDMADGSLRITVEFEPRFAKDAYALFGARGTPLAIAALQVGYAAVGDKSSPTEKPKGGPLAIEAAALCRNPEYLRWRDLCSEHQAAHAMRTHLGIKSRSELDHNEELKDIFIRQFRAPFLKHMMARGIVA